MSPRLLAGITVLNLALILTAWSRPVTPAVSPVVRATGFELIDEKGNVRAQLWVDSSGNGQFRMRNAKGEVAVKLGPLNGGRGSALHLMDPTVEPGISLVAGETSRMTVSRGGKMAEIRP